MSGVVENAGERRWSDAAIFGASHVSWPVRFVWVALASIVLSVLLVFSVEWIFRGSFAEAIEFFAPRTSRHGQRLPSSSWY